MLLERDASLALPLVTENSGIPLHYWATKLHENGSMVKNEKKTCNKGIAVCYDFLA
jgi:hypothetical protein